MSADLCLLVMRHADVETMSQSRKPLPFSRPAAPASVKIAEVDRLTRYQIPATAGANFALSSRDRNSRRFSNKLHPQLVTFPLARLLKPVQINVLLVCQEPEAYSLSGRPILVCINRDDEVGTCRRRGNLKP